MVFGMTSFTNTFPQFFLAIWTRYLVQSDWIWALLTQMAMLLKLQLAVVTITTWLLVLSRARDMSSHHVKEVERNRIGISPDWTWSRDKAESYLPWGSTELPPVPRSPILLESPPFISPEGETITAPFCRNNFSIILFFFLRHLLICKSQKAWTPS